ncbi:MAG: protein kinase [Gemmatimonadetes bacterium]|nr:protein kinase [Gemmatimonadota bacterium]
MFVLPAPPPAAVPEVSDSLHADLQQSLGTSYTLERELGGGGMSHVFVARDNRLERDVVVKVLPPDAAAALSGDRFRREIALAAKLQHPHIVQLLGAGETANGLPYYTMPFVEGESLRQRITREGELPVTDTVGILREVTRALGYAHERGIVHRDIKPDNVMLSGGSAMVTDFGVAKAVTAAADNSAARGTTLTQLGMSLGTPAYMSPEQAAAEPTVDQRTDFYALGCMAYEMLTGHPPFTGRNAAAVIAAQVSELPEPIQKRRPNVPSGLAALVMQCLEKRPADRPHDAREVLHMLDGVVTTPSHLASVVLPADRASKKFSARHLALIAGGLVFAALVGGWIASRAAGSDELSSSTVPGRFAVDFPPGWTLPPLGTGGSQLELSPDGRRLVVRMQRADTARLFERRLDDLAWRAVAGTDGVSSLNFSSDGRFLLVNRRNAQKISRIPIDGGPAEELTSGASFGAGTMGPDGVLFFGSKYNSGLSRLASAGGTPTVFTTPDSSRHELGHWGVQMLPDGKHVLFSSYASPLPRARIEVISASDGKREVVAEGGVNARYANGYLFFAKGDALFAAPFDEKKLRTTAAAQPVIAGLGSLISGGDALYTISQSGTLAYVPREALMPETEVVWSDRTGRMTPAFTRSGAHSDPRVSKDGRLAFLTENGGFASLWVYDPARETFTVVSQREARTLPAVWSHDGRTLYYGVETPTYDVYKRAADASSAESVVNAVAPDKYLLDISADDRTLLIRSAPGANSFLATIPVEASRQPVRVPGTEGDQTDGGISPDGKWLIYISDEAGRHELFLRSWPDVTRARWQLSTNGATSPRWSQNGREIVYRAGDAIMSVAINPATGTPGRPSVLFNAPETRGTFDVSGDGTRFVLTRLADHTSATSPQVVVVTNWIQSLRSRKP